MDVEAAVMETLILTRHVDRFWALYQQEARKLGQKRNVHLKASEVVRAAREARRRVDAEIAEGKL